MDEADIAEQRIRLLFEQAQEKFDRDPDLSDRYVEIAREIGMSYNVSIPSDLRKKFCSNCKAFLVPGANSKVRIDSENQNIIYCCEECGNVDRYGY